MKNIQIRVEINTDNPKTKTVVLSKRDFDKLVRFKKLSGLNRLKLSEGFETTEYAMPYKEVETDLLTTVLKGV